MLRTFSTDFLEYTAGAQPTGWSQYWQVSNRYRVVQDVSTGTNYLEWSGTGLNPDRYALGYDGWGDIPDQEVYTEFTVKSVGPVAGYWGSAAVRIGGVPGNEQGYALFFNSSAANVHYLVLVTYQNGAYTQLGSVQFDWQMNTAYSVRLQATRNNIRASVWLRGTAEPANWTFDVRDSRYATGRPGVVNRDNGTMRWDRWVVSELQDTTPPPTPVTLTRIVLTPGEVQTQAGKFVQFQVTGIMSDSTNRTVNVTFDATGGSINATGRYNVGNTPGDYRVIATETATGLADTTAVVIMPPPVPGLPLAGGTGTEFYVAAHPDDWQIFAGDTTYKSLTTAAKVGFIYVTAGDAGNDSTYWKGRERGAEHSIDTLFVAADWACSIVNINGHAIRRCVRGKVVNYYLRLPDGGSGDGFGFGKGSIRGLKDRSTPVTAIDGSTTYLSWADLAGTVRTIVDQETAGSQLTKIYAQDYDRTFNLNDHRDHSVSGDLVKSASSARAWTIRLYWGYVTSTLPVNIDIFARGVKDQEFVAYQNAINVTGYPPGYTNWMARTYMRTDLTPAPPTTAPPGQSGVMFEATFAGTTGTAPTGWTETSGAANSDWTIAADAGVPDGRVLRDVATSTGRHILRLDAFADTATDQEVLVKIRVGSNNDYGPGVALRHRFVNNVESAYVAFLRPSTDAVEINAFVNGGWQWIANRAFVNNPNTWYWMRFRAEGSTLSVRVWPDGTTEPTTWTQTAVNAALTSGSVGLYTYEAATIDYDVFGAASGTLSAPTPSQGGAPPVTLTRVLLTPDTATVQAGSTRQFSVSGTMSDGSSQNVTVNYTAIGGTITSSGLFTAGSVAGVYSVIAREPVSGLADTSRVTVTDPPPNPTLISISLTPATATLLTAGTQQFAVSGLMSNGTNTNMTVTYNVTGGTITTGGFYTAGITPGSYRVIATDTNTGLADTSAVTINAPAPTFGGSFESTFGETPGSAPTGWTKTSAPANSDWTIANDASVQDGRILRNVATTTGRHILKLDAFADTSTDQEVLVKMRLNANNGYGPGVALRHRYVNGVESAYVAFLRPSIDQVEINAFVNGGWQYVGGRNVVIDPNIWYWLRFRAEGTTLRVKVWADGTAEPSAWSQSANNSALQSGTIGVYSYEPVTVDYDVFGAASAGGTAPTPSQGPPPAPPTLTRVLMTPDSTLLQTGATRQFTVSGIMSDGSSQNVTVNYTATGGTVSNAGLFTAGNTAGTFTLIAREPVSGLADTSKIVITAPPPPPTLARITMTPDSTAVTVGGTRQFQVVGTMSDNSTQNVTVNYTATGGTISAAGLFTAGNTPGTFSVIAREPVSGLADTSRVVVNAAPQLLSYWTSFGEYANNAQPVGWTKTSAPNNATWSVVTDTTVADRTILRNVTTSTARHILRYDAVADTTTTQEVLVRIRISNNNLYGPGVALRHTMNGNAESAYVVYLRPGGGDIEMDAFVNGGWQYLGGRAFTSSPNNWYWIRFRAEGNTLMARAWADNATEPTTWMITTTHGALAAGSAGVYTYESNTVDFDVFSVAAGGLTAIK